MHFALLDNNFDPAGPSYLYREPVGFIRCERAADAARAFDEIEEALRAGFHLVGYARYELGASFGYAMADPGPDPDLPLMCFGIFAGRETLNDTQVEAFLKEREGDGTPFLCDGTWNTDDATYVARIGEIQDHLLAGNSYQVNYTIRHRSRFGGCPFAFYGQLRAAQPVAFGACLNFPEVTALSRSPELFFERRADTLRTRPMKGTAPRHPDDPARDAAARASLRADPKQNSENVMIVDLLRNDLGRIARAGSVSVDDLFAVETYRTVHQMTSTISAEIDRDRPLREIFEALFPCGSITGAPKKRTCEIIAETEGCARGIYTGAIGYITPDRDMCFNVPIRTFVIGKDRTASFGVGGGIVHESEAGAELAEARLKARFLLDVPPAFNALDCFRYAPKTGPQHMEMHLARLGRCCASLGFPVDIAAVRRDIAALLPGLKVDSKIRIQITPAGECRLDAVPLLPMPKGRMRVSLSPQPVSSTDPIFRHKTTNRAFFDRELAQARVRDTVYDVLFANEKGHLTEASYHSLFLRFDQEYLTPSLECGLLDGVGRGRFLHRNAGQVREAQLPVEMLRDADEVLLVSSVRGVVPVEVI
ncbi:aminodeoxychorismate synthase component I [Tropicimonas marinistellae]|uniref:aminodeoxychorismate synthase component I n=1 Tax=Tropicimonas marinistellae TaxID=1739787 RepID=UPI00082B78B5|nr:aminodeoxychorismate synthase component I [Tropicimonas marinistellae]